MSAGAADKSKRPQRKALQLKGQQQPVGTTATNSSTTSTVEELPDNNITIIQVSNTTDNTNVERQPPELPPKNKIIADIFRFPEINAKAKTKSQSTSPSSQQKLQNDYKSNVQIIPSNSNTIQVLSQASSSSSNASGNPYTIPLKASASTQNASTSTTAANANNTNTTTVKVLADGEATTVAVYGTCYPTTSGVNKPPTPKVSKKIILSANSSGITNIRINNEQTQDANVISGNVHYEKVFLSSSIPISSGNGREDRPTGSQPQHAANAIVSVAPQMPAAPSGSPALPRRAAVASIASPARGKVPHQLTRGLTELVISTRPSRRDFHYLKLLNTPLKTQKTSTPKVSSTANANNNIEQSSGNTPSTSTAAVVESIEQRRRSSSTSDAQAPLQRGATVTAAATQTPANGQRGTNNNEFVPQGRSAAAGNAFRIQSPPQVVTPATGGNKRLTLREQQVMQLRREIMHPGGVRLNLRRKDCVGSIAWVDAFGGVW